MKIKEGSANETGINREFTKNKLNCNRLKYPEVNVMFQRTLDVRLKNVRKNIEEMRSNFKKAEK